MRRLGRHFEEIAGSLLLVAVSLIALFNVLSRYLFGNPLSWAEEIATYLFVWMAMLGAALAVKTRQHFVIEFVIERLPGAAGALARVCVALLVVAASAIVFGTGLHYMSWGWNAVTPATEIPRAIPYGAVAMGGVLMLVRALGLLIREIRNVRSGAASDPGKEGAS